MFAPTFMASLPMNLFVNNYIYGFRPVNIKYVINNLEKKNTVGTIFTDWITATVKISKEWTMLKT